ncbi:carboxypeptidase regulatory-like domain-containing protein [Pseudaquabacterium terrae]|uniref:carboxypeptidase regulatory-like domain-containing protein n=1 Tax=Pseudaquabacterium terrae TaxID=2732868 RepID=UPI0015679733
MRTIPVTGTAIAADIHGGVWLTTSTAVKRIDGSGAMQIDLPMALPHMMHHVSLATDPSDGSVWLSYIATSPEGGPYNNRLVHVGTSGAVLSSTTFSIPSSSRAYLAVGFDGAVFALSDRTLVRFTAQGVESARTTLSLRNGVAIDASEAPVLDALGSALWYRPSPGSASSGCGTVATLARINLNDLAQAPTELGHCNAMPMVDTPTGEVWTVRPGKNLSRLSASGAVLSSVTFAAQYESRVVARDARSGEIWMLTRSGGVYVLATNGVVLAQIAGPNVGAISLPPFQFVPTLDLLAPPAQTTTNTTPTFTLGYGTHCFGVPCALPADRLGNFQLTAVLDGVSIANGFTYDAATRQANHVPSAAMAEGVHQFNAKITDRFGRESNGVASSITIDRLPPSVQGLSPPNNARFNQPSITVSGQIGEPGAVTLGAVTQQGPTFNFGVGLTPGANQLSLTATDAAGNSGQTPLTYHYLTVAISSPTDGATVSTPSVSVTGIFAGPADTAITVNDAAANISGSNFSANVPLAVGPNTVTVKVTSAGVTASRAIIVTRSSSGGGGSLNPTPNDPTTTTIMGRSTEFLYKGANPIQIGVLPQTIEPKRAAVVRGKVTDATGNPLEGVKVQIHKNATYGHTFTRADGVFDMAVNGGGPLRVSYVKPGFIGVHRNVHVRWQDYAVVDDVVLTALDPLVTTVSLDGAQPMQAARGSVSTDEDGTRRATVLFPQGTTAAMVLANGTQQPLTTLGVRATEFTVGSKGPAAMPAPLDPTTAYTYAAEFSVDEAIAAGATEVRFSKAVPIYVENFIGFPVGGVVPLGYYNRELGVWVPMPNGRIVKVMSVGGGSAALDIDGDGAADSGESLSQLGITAEELSHLSSLYAPGQSLWRVTTTHFTPLDMNWAPPPPGPPPSPPPASRPPGCSGTAPGSIIECHNQVLREEVPIAGTSLALAYSSRDTRTSIGALRTVTVPVVGSPNPLVVEVLLEAHIAGRRFSWKFPASINSTQDIQWDGLDAYGRVVSGAAEMTIRIGYVYKSGYTIPADVPMSFGRPGGGQMDVDVTRTKVTNWTVRRFPLELGRPDQRMGGWTLSDHHHYDPISRTLLLGNGEQRSGDPAHRVGGGGAVLTRVLPLPGEGPIQERATGTIAVTPNGAIYAAHPYGHWPVGPGVPDFLRSGLITEYGFAVRSLSPNSRNPDGYATSMTVDASGFVLFNGFGPIGGSGEAIRLFVVSCGTGNRRSVSVRA